MFEFLMDAGNYDERKVDRTEYEHGFISTARVSDGRRPYETAIEDYRYADGTGNTQSMLIVAAYDTREHAERGHKQWVKLMTNSNPPEKLVECQNAQVAQFADACGINFDQTLVVTND